MNSTKQSQNRRAKLTQDQRQAYAMLLPWVVGFCLFTIYPIAWIFRYSFFSFDGFQKEYIGIENFVRLFARDPYFWKSVVNTFILAFMNLLVQIPLGLVLAVVLNSRLKGRTLFRTVFFLPNIISVAIVGVLFFFLFAAYQGIINNFLQFSGLIEKPINWFGNKWTALVSIAVSSIWQSFGIVMIFFLTGLQSIPLEMYEHANLEGASQFQKFINITMPMLAPMIQIILLLAILGSLKMTDLVLVLTSGQPGGQSEVMMTYTFKYFFIMGIAGTRTPQIGYAASLGVIASIILGIITFAYLRMTKHMRTIY